MALEEVFVTERSGAIFVRTHKVSLSEVIDVDMVIQCLFLSRVNIGKKTQTR